MSTVLSPPEQRVVLHNVSWETYERLLEENPESRSPRFTYDDGELEIMTLSPEHEWYSRLIAELVKLLARDLRVDILDLGSTTFKRKDAKRGFEPDSCFYVTHVQKMRGKKKMDLTVDPPPEIVVEVAVTHPSISKFPICAQFGVREIWTYDGDRLSMHRLAGCEYAETPSSEVLPELAAAQLSEFLEMGKKMDSVTWPDEVINRFRTKAH